MPSKPRLARLVATVCAVALGVPAAGCGGDGSDEFRDDYNAAVDKLSKINGDIGSVGADGDDQSNAMIAEKITNIADTADEARADLAALEPPEDAQDEFDKLLAAIETGVADLRSMAKAAESNDPEQAQTAAQELAESGQQITAAENALKTVVDG